MVHVGLFGVVGVVGVVGRLIHQTGGPATQASHPLRQSERQARHSADLNGALLGKQQQSVDVDNKLVVELAAGRVAVHPRLAGSVVDHVAQALKQHLED